MAMTPPNFTILVIFSSIIGSCVFRLMASRGKRVMGGIPVDYRGRNTYQAIRQYVWIGYEWRSEIDEEVNSTESDWYFGYFKEACGGSLLTTKIVQTACHCLADGDMTSKSNRSRYILSNVFEKYFFSYPGWHKVQDRKPGFAPAVYMIRETCARVPPIAVVSDFGLIILKERITEADHLEINYAPIYPKADLERMYYEFIGRQAVCLIVGFGYYFSYALKNKTIFVSPDASYVLRHGWVQLMDYIECYETLFANKPDTKTSDLNYTKEADFGCTHSATKIGSNFQFHTGDSGGPLSCDDQYFGIVSYSPDSNLWGAYALIAFSLYENAAEYRREFRILTEYIHYKNPDLPTFKPTIPLPVRALVSRTLPASQYRFLLLVTAIVFKCQYD